MRDWFQRVGWVERSETHHSSAPSDDGYRGVYHRAGREAGPVGSTHPTASLRHRRFHEPLRVLAKLPHDLVVIGVLHRHRLQPVFRQPQQRRVRNAIRTGECVAMMIWQWPIFSIRRISFKNSIWREGDSADSGSSKMKMPCRWQRSSKKRRNPSPCECERKSA